MAGVFGLNILGQYVSDRGALIAYARRLNPAAFLVMDAPDLFQALQQTLPSALAIYRAYHPNDAEPHLRWTPQAWLDEFADIAVGGFLQVGNEPNGYADPAVQVRWYVDVMRAARSTTYRRRLAVCAYGVGHPSEKDIQAGVFDLLLRELADGYHLLVLHEYARESTVTERPHHIGRFAYWRDRARALGINPPSIVIGEYERDNVGPGTGGAVNDGWRGAGWAEERYAAFLRGAADLYARTGIPALIYCYGRGAGGMWQSFNVEGAVRLLDELAAMNTVYTVSATAPEVPPPTRGCGLLVRLKGAPTRIRASRSTNAPIFATVPVGAELAWYPSTQIEANGLTWVEVRFGSIRGYMARVQSSFDEQFECV